MGTNLTRTMKMLSKGSSERPVPVKTDLIPPGFKEGDKIAFILDNVFTKEECDEMIRASEEHGYEQALVNIGFGRQKLLTDVRNNFRCIIDSKELANVFLERITKFIPQTVGEHGCEKISLNERLRFLRYDPGEYFKPHYDGIYRRDNDEQSLITVQIYLNEGFEGGSTTFLPTDSVNDKVECVPKIGRVLVFEHHLYHEGSLLKAGRKYAIRTDVMYTPPNSKSSNQDNSEG